MMKTDPITPPPELVEQWISEHYGAVSVAPGEATSHVATEAARWGADQELEACCEWIPKRTSWDAEQLRAARRPKPPSLKEQALLVIDTAVNDHRMSPDAASIILRALEPLDD